MEKYQEYIKLEKQIEELEAKKSLLREDIASDLPDTGYKDETIAIGWRVSKKITYPSDVLALEVNVKQAIIPIQEKFNEEIKPLVESVETAKKLSEQNGTATVDETKTLTIKIAK